MQYKLLISIDDKDKREFYELEAVKNCWTGSKNNEMVKLALPENNKTILASQYKMYLPSENQLLEELKKELAELKNE